MGVNREGGKKKKRSRRQTSEVLYQPSPPPAKGHIGQHDTQTRINLTKNAHLPSHWDVPTAGRHLYTSLLFQWTQFYTMHQERGHLKTTKHSTQDDSLDNV